MHQGVAGEVSNLLPTGRRFDEIGLVGRLREGIPEAFDEYMEYCGKALAVAMGKRLGNSEEAADVHMEALEAALGYGTPAEAWQPEKGCSFKTWVWRLAGQRASKVLRKRMREVPGVERDVAELVGASMDGIPLTDGDEPREVSPRAALVRKLIEGLPKTDQLLFRFKFEDQLDDELIAEKLGVKPSTVRVKVHRLLQKVKKHIQL